MKLLTILQFKKFVYQLKKVSLIYKKQDGNNKKLVSRKMLLKCLIRCETGPLNWLSQIKYWAEEKNEKVLRACSRLFKSF